MKKKIITCDDVTQHVCGELDGRLDSPECRRLRKHLESCPNCTAYLDSLKKTIRLYKECPTPHLPKGKRRELIAVLKIR